MPAPSYSAAPSPGAFAITKSDSDPLPRSTRRIYVGGTGDLNLVTLDGDTVKFESVPVGAVLEVCAKQVLSTGTTATKLVGMT